MHLITMLVSVEVLRLLLPVNAGRPCSDRTHQMLNPERAGELESQRERERGFYYSGLYFLHWLDEG